ncbi:uncharacterized protein LODBEIA_P29100 [Lodderomyces beijingensis]|uniref:Mitochondrial distribution and morphology protein 31 n=1 Tax=Lodderomyces beijingensis TaxID=1775926 RepID=A0ABP0ZP59_9ASCO
MRRRALPIYEPSLFRRSPQHLFQFNPSRSITHSLILLQQQSQDSKDNRADKGNEKHKEHRHHIPSPSEIIPHVTKEQLLARANNFYSRLRVRIKWLLKKSNRPYNTDDYSAFFSWLVVGNVLLFFLATTTFVSIVIFTANTVFAQEFVAKKIGEFITKNSNMTVTFESAIVPGWSDGKISFRKCFVSRRPKKIEKFTKGSQQEAYEKSLQNYSKEEDTEDQKDFFEDDGNYTQFDLTIEEVNISLSFNKWVNGTGIIETMDMKGLRGVVDRTHVRWDPNDDARNYKNVYQPGDFEIEDFKMEDILFELKQPNDFRVFDVAIFNCELSKLRKHWLFYDFLNANVMSGSYDNSLFTIHKKQRLTDFATDSSEPGDFSSQWKRITCLRVDGLNIDHLNKGLEGPFGWITSGKVDLLGEIMVPQEHSEITVTEIVNSIASSIKKEATRYKNPEVHSKHPDLHTRLTSNDYKDISKYFVLDLTLRLNNVRATVPFKAPELTYVNYALIRPIVAYINSKNTFIEIHNRIVKNISDFDGSWTLYDSLLMDDISEEVYDNFAEYVVDEEARVMRAKRVGFWSLQLLAQMVLLGLGTLA